MPWGIIAGLVGTAISSSKTNSAVGTQTQGEQAKIDEQRRQYDQTRSDYAPYRAAGGSALGLGGVVVCM